ncbi:MAG: hypothetical protein KDA60_00715, partial [Planctomycetales bacterium]|nr:hypothetical protein [Planctomycetales bacterium]
MLRSAPARMSLVTLMPLVTLMCSLSAGTPAAGQDVELVSPQSHWDVLFTTVELDGRPFVGAADPTVNGTNEGFTLPGMSELWAETNYDLDAPVNSVIVDTGESFQNHWLRDLPQPFYYDEILYFQDPANNVPLGTDVLVATGLRQEWTIGNNYTHYFRTTFETTAPSDFLVIEGIQDDGAIFYIDGIEVGRMNCCAETTFGQPSDFTERSGPEFTNTDGCLGQSEVCYRSVRLDLSNLGGELGAGSHVLGVANKQFTAGSTDMGSFVQLFAAYLENEWTGAAANGAIDDPLNWSLLQANSQGEGARFLSGPAENENTSYSVYANMPVSLGGVIFDSSEPYALSGLGQIEIATSGSELAEITVRQGHHEFQLPVSFATDASIDVNDGSLQFNNEVRLNGHTVTTTGDVAFNHRVDTAGGTILAIAGAVGGTATV